MPGRWDPTTSLASLDLMSPFLCANWTHVPQIDPGAPCQELLPVRAPRHRKVELAPTGVLGGERVTLKGVAVETEVFHSIVTPWSRETNIPLGLVRQAVEPVLASLFPIWNVSRTNRTVAASLSLQTTF